MFDTIYVENELAGHQRTKDILERCKGRRVKYIDAYDQVWGRVKKPYLQKREKLNLFIARKKGQLVKEAPNAYGIKGEKHYYYIHAYNCIYECQYCYLQGYFQTPDIVLFINHEDIINEMQKILDQANGEKIWFHAGEFSDSLALSHITGELEPYWSFFQKNPNSLLELRSKSVNLKRLATLPPLPNAYVSFSLSPQKSIKDIDLKTPPLRARLKALGEVIKHGHRTGVHLDPIVWQQDTLNQYEELADQICCAVDIQKIDYFSLGVVRFTSDVFHQAKTNYPKASMLSAPFEKTQDDIIRYPRPMRRWILNQVKEILVCKGVSVERIYLCMEEA